jgi:hypothetical protein
MNASMMIEATVCAVFVFMTAAPSSRPRLCAVSTLRTTLVTLSCVCVCVGGDGGVLWGCGGGGGGVCLCVGCVCVCVWWVGVWCVGCADGAGTWWRNQDARMHARHDARTHTHTHTQTGTHTHTHTQTGTHTHAHTRTHTRTHTHSQSSRHHTPLTHLAKNAPAVSRRPPMRYTMTWCEV